MISSYIVNKDVVKVHFDNTCYGIAKIVRGDGTVMKSARGPERPIHQSELAMQDAIELSLCSEFDDFFDTIHNGPKTRDGYRAEAEAETYYRCRCEKNKKNNGRRHCETCFLVSYGRDCRNNPL